MLLLSFLSLLIFLLLNLLSWHLSRILIQSLFTLPVLFSLVNICYLSSIRIRVAKSINFAVVILEVLSLDPFLVVESQEDLDRLVSDGL